MFSRLMFRERGQVIRTHSTAREVAITVVVMVTVVLLLVWGHQVDRTTAEAFEAGRQVGRAEMADSVGDAYAQGVRDARAAMAAGLHSLEVQP